MKLLGWSDLITTTYSGSKIRFEHEKEKYDIVHKYIYRHAKGNFTIL